MNRGQRETAQLLLETRASLEVRNLYGRTALGAAIWAAIDESRPSHVAIVDGLLKAGARVEAVGSAEDA